MATELLKGYSQLPEEFLLNLYEYTGGRPYFIKLLLSKIFELYHLGDKQHPALSVDMLQSSIESVRVGRRADEVLKDVYSTYLTDDERYVILWLTNNDGFLTVEEVIEAGIPIREALKEIEHRDYVVKSADGRYRLQFTLLGLWLSSWPRYVAEIERLQVPGRTVSLEVVKETPIVGLPSEIVMEGVCIDLTTQNVYVDGHRVEDDPADLSLSCTTLFGSTCGTGCAK